MPDIPYETQPVESDSTTDGTGGSTHSMTIRVINSTGTKLSRTVNVKPGARVLLSWSFIGDSSGLTLQLRRGGTVIDSQAFSAVTVYNALRRVVDTPPAGTYVYDIYCSARSGTTYGWLQMSVVQVWASSRLQG